MFGTWRRQCTFDCRDEIGNLDEASGPAFAPLGHFAVSGTDEANAVQLKLHDVAARRRIEPHARVHCRRNENGLVRRKQNGSREVVGMTAGHACDEVGCRGCDDDEIGIARQPDVADLAFVIQVEEIGEYPFVRQCRDGKRRHELMRGLRHHDAHVMAALFQAPDQVQALVGGNAAADDQKNALCR